jgi:hypothetical protein
MVPVDARDSRPYLIAPAGRVQVISDFDDGTRSVSALTFGGNGALPQDIENDQIEATNEVSWISNDGAHRVKLGGLVNLSRFNQDFATNRNGTFTYQSLEDLENNTPAQFTRTLAPSERNGGIWNSALYLGDTWRKSRALQVTYGVRLEHSSYDGAPRNNPDVEAKFGRRTDRFPSETHLSPRVGFTWTLGLPPQQSGGAGTPAGSGGAFAGGGRGAGGFAGGGRAAEWAEERPAVPGRSPDSRRPSFVAASASSADGRPTVSSPARSMPPDCRAPSRSWCALAARSRFPTGRFTPRIPRASPRCAPTVAVAPPRFSNQRPNVTTFDPDFGAPRSWRASLGVQRRDVRAAERLP